MEYISVRDALATILTKSAPVEDVLVNVAPEDRQMVVDSLAHAKDKLSKGSTEVCEKMDQELIKWSDHGQWQLQTTVHYDNAPQKPAGPQAEPKDQNPDNRTGVNIDKAEDSKKESVEEFKARGGEVKKLPPQETPEKIGAQPTRGVKGFYSGRDELNAKKKTK